MADDIKKNNEAKFSINTIFVLLLVIGGFLVILFAALLLIKPGNTKNDTVITELIVPDTPPEENDILEDIEESLDSTYLRESVNEKEDKVSENEPELKDSITDEVPPVIPKAELKTETPSIFTTKKNTTIKKSPTKTTVVKKTAPKVRKKLVTVKAYWIQVGSFSTSAKAKASVAALKERGLSSRVVLKVVNGKSVYRVRIGAYESKAEAETFCAEVKKIEGYDGSYVSETTTQKYINY